MSEPTEGRWTTEPPIPSNGHAWHFTSTDPNNPFCDRIPRRIYSDGWHGDSYWWWSVPIQEPPR